MFAAGDDHVEKKAPDHEASRPANPADEVFDPAESGNPQSDRNLSAAPSRIKVDRPITRRRGYVATVVIATLVGLVAGGLLALWLPAYYISHSEILIRPQSMGAHVASGYGQSYDSAVFADIDSKVRIITSGTVTGKVVERLHLESDPEFNRERSSVFRRFDSLFGLEPATIDENARKSTAAENLQDALSVSRVKGTFVVRVGVRSQGARKAALVANAVTDAFLDVNRNLQAENTARNRKSVSARLSQLRASAREAEDRVASFRAEHAVGKDDGQGTLEDEISKVSAALETMTERVKELDARVTALKGADVDRLLSGDSLARLSTPSLTTLRQRYAQANREIDRLSVNLGERHPRLREAKSSRDALRRDIRSELDTILRSAEADLKSANLRKQDLALRLSDLKGRLADRDSQLDQLRKLERNANAARSAYENFMLKAADPNETGYTDRTEISVISKAAPPLSPAGPNHAIIVISGALAGLVGGLLLAARPLRSPVGPGTDLGRENAGGPAGLVETLQESPVQRRVGEANRHGSDGSALWPAPDMMPVNPYDNGSDGKYQRATPAAYKGIASSASRRLTHSADEADIAELNERLKAFRKKIDLVSRPVDDKYKKS